MNDRTPYTYVVVFLASGQRYYGVRYAKGCHPNDLWTTYFTSCTAIKTLVRIHGKTAFKTEVRKTFQSIRAAQLWEHNVLRRLRVPSNPRWFNKTDNLAIPDQTGTVRSKETRHKLSQSKIGQRNPQYGKIGTQRGKKLSEHTKNKIATALRGRKTGPCPESRKLAISLAKIGKKRQPFSDEWRKNIGLSRTGSKHWNFGKHFSEESKSKMRMANSVRVTCPFCKLTGGIRAMRRYHFSNCKA